MEAILSVAALFILRVGLPIVLLVLLGVVVDRWQKRRDDQLKAHYAQNAHGVVAGFAEPQAAAETSGEVRTGTHG